MRSIVLGSLLITFASGCASRRCCPEPRVRTAPASAFHIAQGSAVSAKPLDLKGFTRSETALLCNEFEEEEFGVGAMHSRTFYLADILRMASSAQAPNNPSTAQMRAIMNVTGVILVGRVVDGRLGCADSNAPCIFSAWNFARANEWQLCVNHLMDGQVAVQ